MRQVKGWLVCHSYQECATAQKAVPSPLLPPPPPLLPHNAPQVGVNPEAQKSSLDCLKGPISAGIVEHILPCQALGAGGGPHKAPGALHSIEAAAHQLVVQGSSAQPVAQVTNVLLKVGPRDAVL